MLSKILKTSKTVNEPLKPFLRWAGGKQNLIKEIINKVNIEGINRYFEPFLGGASFFLYNSFNYSFLSDLNGNLINCYLQIKENHKEVHRRLMTYQTPVLSDLYYQIREDFNNNIGQNSVDQAVRFIFLNKTSFNGIYRVNKRGLYNVPFGKQIPSFPSIGQLEEISQKLKNANLFTGYYDEIEELVQPNDLIYLDPPYPKLSDTSCFNHYTFDKFDLNEQNRLADFASRLNARGCKIIISNADLPQIHDLYVGWDISELNVIRYISCKKERHKIKELIIKNF